MIEKHWKLDYILLRNWIVLTVRLFYRRIQLGGHTRKWPHKKPVLLAPNHQNSFLDGITLEVMMHENIYHLIRGGAFGNPLLDKIFSIVHLLPIYRERDGMAAVRKNAQIMEGCYDLLSRNESVVVFPEGRFSPIKKMWPLQKGIGRMAIGYVEKYGWDTGLVIWPVGLNYNDPDRYGADVYINYGEQIDIRDFKEVYEENPRKAVNEIMKRLSEGLKEVLIDIESEEHYEGIEFLRSIYVREYQRRMRVPSTDLASAFKIGKKLTERLNVMVTEERIGDLTEEVLDYKKGLEEAGIRDWTLRKRPSTPFMVLGLAGLILLSPLFLVAAAGNALPYFLTEWVANNKIKERQFRSSVLMAAAMPFFSLWYLLVFGVLAIVLPNWYMVLFVMFAIVVSGYFSEWYFRRWLKKLMGGMSAGSKWDSPAIRTLREKRAKLYSALDTIMSS